MFKSSQSNDKRFREKEQEEGIKLQKNIKIIIVILPLLMLIFTSNRIITTATRPEENPIKIENEGFKPVILYEDDSKIIFELEDEEDGTVIGIDFAVDLGEEDVSLIKVKNDKEDIKTLPEKPLKLKLVFIGLGMFFLAMGLRILFTKILNPQKRNIIC